MAKPVSLMPAVLCFIFLTIFNKATGSSCPSNCQCSEATVDCTGKDIVGFPSGIPTNTKILRIHATNLTQIPANALGNLVNLEDVSLLNNKLLTTLPAGLFDNLFELNKIVINYNKVTDIPNGLFKNLTNLETIQLKKNGINNLPGATFRNLPKLNYLNLEKNQIRFLPAELFDKTVPNIETLHFNENLLSSLPDDFFHSISKSLRYLLIGYNQFHKMPVKALKSIEKLEEINVLGNPLFCNCSIKDFVDWATKSRDLIYLPNISCGFGADIELSKLILDNCSLQEKATPTAISTRPTPTRLRTTTVVDSTQTSIILTTQQSRPSESTQRNILSPVNGNTETQDSSEDNKKRNTIILAVSISVVVVVIIIALILCFFHTGILSSARCKGRKNHMMVYDAEVQGSKESHDSL